MPQLTVAGSDTSGTEKPKPESAMSSAAPSPSPSTASSKDDRVKTGKGVGDGKDRDLADGNTEENSVDGDVNETEKKTSTDIPAEDDAVKNNADEVDSAKAAASVEKKDPEVKMEVDEVETKADKEGFMKCFLLF